MAGTFTPMQNAIRLVPRVCLFKQPIRGIYITAARMAEGSVGGMRFGGQAHDDAFTSREKAAENMYIRAREAEILKLLREKVAKQGTALEAEKRLLADLEEHYGDEAEEALRTRYSKNL